MKFPPLISKKKNDVPRGFVLSFTVLTLALFILIYAQIQSEHLFKLRLQESNLEQRTLPLRFALDARADLNMLLDERVRVDQNSTNADTWISGTLPSPIAFSTVLARYQTGLSSLGRDANLSVLLDLNAVFSDENVTGRLSNGLIWKRNFSGNKAIIAPLTTAFLPENYDINLTASLPSTSTSPWSLNESGNIYVTLRYTDQNTGHTTASAGWLTANSTAKEYTWTYGGGSALLSLRVGLLDRNAGSLFLDNNNTSALDVKYTIHVTQDANGSTPTLAGYDLPLSVIGPDGNFIAGATQWLTN